MESYRSSTFVTTQEAALRLGCSIQHVRVLIRAGKLEAQKIGRDWMCEGQALEALTRLRYEREAAPPSYVKEQLNYTLFPEASMGAIVNVASVPQRSPFRYPGGKSWLIPLVREWLDSMERVPRMLVEPFCGGASISLMAAFEQRADRCRMVELDEAVAGVWRTILGGQGAQLAEMIVNFQFTEAAVRGWLNASPDSELERAFQTVLRNRVSRGGILAPGAGLVKTGEGGKGMASRWYPETLAKRILAIEQHREKLDFREGDGLEDIRSMGEDRDVVLFVDPPYPLAGRRLYSMGALDHEHLFQLLSNCKAPFLATYDDNAKIEDLARFYGFDCNKVPMKSTHHAKKMELIVSRSLDWMRQPVSVETG
jgi:DNA adenine methylase